MQSQESATAEVVVNVREGLLAPVPQVTSFFARSTRGDVVMYLSMHVVLLWVSIIQRRCWWYDVGAWQALLASCELDVRPLDDVCQ